MARRRSAPGPAPDALEPPAELMTCFVEDWAPDYAPSPYACPQSMLDVARFALLEAGRRHGRARREWLHESGVPFAEWKDVLPRPHPRFRDYAAFEAEMSARYGNLITKRK